MAPPVRDVLRPVNIASATHRSLFRYPGGKSWLIPEIRRWLDSLHPDQRRTLIEPFGGGAIVSLTAVAEGLVDEAVLVELDADVASVWEVVLNGDSEDLVTRILDYQLTLENVRALLAQPIQSAVERAFVTIVRNRVNRGGILAPRAGLSKEGGEGKGITGRWYPETLAKRIRSIGQYRDRIRFIHGDGIAVLEEFRSDSSAVAFVDPPYTAAGKRAGSRLYTHHEVDHEGLFDCLLSFSGDFMMTYDHEAKVTAMATARGFDTRGISMRSSHHATMTELLVGRNFDWFDA